MKNSEYPKPQQPGSLNESKSCPSSSSSPPRLHSRYNPQAEAERYVAAAVQLIRPEFIVVTEPGEGFLAEALKKKCPNALLCAVRYQDEFFRESDALWDCVWRPSSGIAIETFLYNIIPDDAMPAAAFISWKASDAFWPNEAKAAWEAIGSFIRIQQSVMATRAAFGRRWLKNCVKNVAKAEYPALLPQITAPPLIVASGPQLERFPAAFFEEIESRFFVAALSSASAFLAARGVTPDAVISTDGGYWAGRLFARNFADAPVMFPLEALIPNFALEEGRSVFLSYGSALEDELFGLCRIEPLAAERNGTVSGTAAAFFLRHTAGNVYAAGLDLKSGNGFQHARPHPSSPEKAGSFFRLNPIENQAAASGLSSSLHIYRSWFENMKEERARRFFRIESAKGELSALGKIKAVTLAEIEAAIPPKEDGRKRLQATAIKPSAPLSSFERTKAVREWLLSEASRMTRQRFLSDTESEIIKMHSYQGFLSFVKAKAQGDASKMSEVLSDLRKGAQGFLVALAERLK